MSYATRFILFVTVLLFSFQLTANAYAGKGKGIVKGKLLNTATKEPFSDVRVSIPDIKVETTTNGEGDFIFNDVPYGKYDMTISGTGVVNKTVLIVVGSNVTDLKEMYATPTEQKASPESVEIPTIGSLDGSEVSADEEGGSDGGSNGGIIVADKDPFLYTSTFVWGAYRYMARGYGRTPRRSGRNESETEVNGIPVNNLENGNASWEQFGGLTDVFHNRDVTYGLTPSEYAFGGVLGSQYFDASAAAQRAGLHVSYSLTDRTYKNRVMVTYSSGISKTGWAYSVSVSKKWAKEGYIPGTFYDGYGYYAAASKIYRKHQFDIIAYGAPTKRGGATTVTNEMRTLSGTNYYNPDWGYQRGQKRNANITNTFQPQFILAHTYSPNDKTKLHTAVSYEFGKYKHSTLDGYNAFSPYPDYYRNLPSFYENEVPSDPTTAAAVRQDLMNNPQKLQIDWNRMYNDNYTNTQTLSNINGVAGNDYTGRRSEYVLANNVSDLKKWVFNTTLSHAVSKYFTVYAGATLIHQSTENYKQLADLLGGKYFVNYNQFAAQEYVGNTNYYQNDVNNPNRIIRVGDKYGYDYDIRYTNAKVWGQAVVNYNRFEAFLAATAGSDMFYRVGEVRNGLFPNNSYGQSTTQSFFTYAVKGGLKYVIDPRNDVYVNAIVDATPPSPENTYISAQTRDFAVSNPQTQNETGVEGGYRLHSSIFNARVSGYASDVKNSTVIERFYDDDPAVQTFVNYVMQNVATRHIGTELALDVKVLPVLDITGVASVGQAFYTNAPTVSEYKDVDTARTTIARTVYIKNYYLAVGPQSFYTLGFNYHPSGHWFADINLNYMDRNYVDINPDRRTPEAVDLLTPGSAQWNSVVGQEKLPAAFTVDLRAGKTFLLLKKSAAMRKISAGGTLLSINVGVNNLLNNTNVITRGYEQLRYDFSDKNTDKFPTKYEYGYGINFFLNVSLKF